MTEKALEDWTIQRVKDLGGISYKFTSPSRRGVPDRIIIMPGNKIGFLELKATGQEPTKLQLAEMRKLSDKSCMVEWTDSKEGVDSFLEDLKDS